MQRKKHQEVTTQGRLRKGHGEGDEGKAARQGRTGPGCSHDGERKQLKVWVGELHDLTFVLGG